MTDSSGFVVENRIWDAAELLPRPELEALQVQRLRATMERVAKVPFYREVFARSGVCPQDIRSPRDVRLLPFTAKDALREHYPLGF